MKNRTSTGPATAVITTELRIFKITTGFLALALAVLAIGFACHLPWATELYPWPDGKLSYTWVGAMFGAYTLPFCWLSWSGEQRSAGPGFLALALAGFGLGWHFNEEMIHLQQGSLSKYAVGAVLFGLFCSSMALWASFSPVSAVQRLSQPWLRWAFFTPVVCIVMAASILLLMRRPYVFPWPLKPETSVMFGILFLTSGLYHAFAIFRSEWRHSKGQLLGFVGYNLVLIWPYLKHFAVVKPAHRLSLTGFTIIIVLTSIIAAYVLIKSARIDRASG